MTANSSRWHKRDPAVTGYVKGIRPYWADSALAVVPLDVGSGIRVKILTAMAASVPVVSTTVGYQGIDLTPGEHILVADDDIAFADAVVRLLRDVALRRRLAVHRSDDAGCLSRSGRLSWWQLTNCPSCEGLSRQP